MKRYTENITKAMEWIKNNTIDDNGIAVTNVERRIYPEVTGYYIPTLLEWNEKELAIKFAKYLCSIQKQNGSWYDPSDSEPYVFDTAQVLKGLVAVYNYLPEVKDNIQKGADWILSNMTSEGQLTTPNKDAWGDDENFCSELVHTYCLTPLCDATKILEREEYQIAANKIKHFYLLHYERKILDFSLLSHFYAYVMDGLLDMGEENIVREAMDNIVKYQNGKGGIPGLKDVKWCCSTGMFQLAIVWYKLGEVEKGNRIFEYACSLQNPSGGWYGSYPVSIVNRYFSRGKKRAYYFANEEISWANKYFLDAMYWKQKNEKCQ